MGSEMHAPARKAGKKASKTPAKKSSSKTLSDEFANSSGDEATTNDKHDSESPKKKTTGSTGKTREVAPEDPNKDGSSPATWQPSHADIEKARKSNVPGVNFVWSSSDVVTTPLMAGYLGLSSTKELRSLLDEIESMPIYDSWRDSRAQGFGVEGKTLRAVWAKAHMFKLIVTPTQECKAAIVTGVIPVSEEAFPHTNVNRGYVTWIVAMHAIMIAYPDAFPPEPVNPTDSEADPTAALPLGGMSHENWNRAYELLRYIHRNAAESRTDLKRRADKVARTQDKPAILPYYLSARDFRLVDDAEGDGLTAMNPKYQQYLDMEHDHARYDSASGNDRDHNSDLDYATDDDDEDEKVFDAGVAKMSARKGNTLMPLMEAPMIKATAKMLGQRAKFLHGDTFLPRNTKPPTTDLGSNPDVNALQDELATSSELEGGLRENNIKVPVDEQASFWEMQRRLNSVSSVTISYEDACADLGLGRDKPQIGAYTLEPWQVTGVWWILYMWKHGLGTAVLGDDVGLGKTLTALCALVIGIRLAKNPIKGAKHDLGLTGDYTPTVILCPAAAFPVWNAELAALEGTGLKLRIWAGSASKNAESDRIKTIGSEAKTLEEFKSKFDTKDPDTAAYVILTTLQTFHRRVLTSERKSEAPTIQSDQSNENDEDDEDEDEEEDALKPDQLRYLDSKAKGWFNLCFVDEAHLLKNHRTRAHQAVVLSKFKVILLITATITINRVSDMSGILKVIVQHLRGPLLQVFNDNRLPTSGDSGEIENSEEDTESTNTEDEAGDEEEDEDEDEGDGATLEDYQNQRDEALKLTAVNLVDWDKVVFLLNPKSYRDAMNANKHGRTAMDLSTIVLNAVLGLIQLRRVKGQKMMVGGVEMVIGAKVPRYQLFNLELQQSPQEAALYAEVYKKAMMAKQRREELGNGGLNMGLTRLLTQASVHPKLVNVKKFSTETVAKFNELNDYGYSKWHRLATSDNALPPYRDRGGATISVAAHSVKLQVLLGFANEICLDMSENLIIFCDFPSIQWLAELVHVILGIQVLTIRAGHSRKERAETQNIFNDKRTTGTVLITSPRCAATSMNLQFNCRFAVFVNPQHNAGTLAQAIGRINRMGQLLLQYIWVLTTWGTFDSVLMSTAAEKMYPQLAATSNIEVTKEEIDQVMQDADALALVMGDINKDNDDNVDIEAKDPRELVASSLRRDKIIDLYTHWNGQRVPKHGMKDLLQPILETESEKKNPNPVRPSKVVVKIYETLTKEINTRKLSMAELSAQLSAIKPTKVADSIQPSAVSSPPPPALSVVASAIAPPLPPPSTVQASAIAPPAGGPVAPFRDTARTPLPSRPSDPATPANAPAPSVTRPNGIEKSTVPTEQSPSGKTKRPSCTTTGAPANKRRKVTVPPSTRVTRRSTNEASPEVNGSMGDEVNQRGKP